MGHLLAAAHKMKGLRPAIPGPGLRLVLIVLLLLAGGARAMPDVIIQAGVLSQPLSPLAQYYFDRDGNRTLAEIRTVPEARWIRSHSRAPVFGYREDALWIRTSLQYEGRQPQTWLLELAYPLLDSVDIYLLTASGALSHWSLGDTQPFAHRPLAAGDFLVPLRLEPEQRYQVYLRVQTSSSLSVPLNLWQEDQYFAVQQSTLVGHGLYYGIILIMVLYNLFIYFSVRHVSYLYYIGAALGCAAYVATVQGLGYQFLWPEQPWFNEVAVAASLSVFGLLGLLFTASLLDTRRHTPRAHQVLRLLTLCFAIELLLSFVLPARASTIMVSVLGMPTTLIVICIGIYLTLQRVRVARFFLLAWSILLVSVFCTGLGKFGLLPDPFLVDYAVELASAAEAILFSFALADRINDERRATLAAHQNALANEVRTREEEHRLLELKYQTGVNALKNQESLLRARAENEAKSRFLATMSHEIRTPLNGVLGMSQLMADTPLEANQRFYVDAIAQSGHTLLAVVDDFMDYSHIAAGTLELKPVDVDLEQVCHQCLTAFAASAENKQLELICRFTADAPRQVRLDPVRLRQILLNLLANAVKFTAEGYVILKVAPVDAGAKGVTRGLRFEVEDTGMGIPPEVQETLFQAFSQADLTVSRQFGGSGLGLNISKKLVELMGGEIGVSSAPDCGSCFWFTVQARQASSEFVQAQALPLAPLRDKTALLLNLSVPLTQALHEQLSGWQMQVQSASRVEEAIDRGQRQERIDYLVLNASSLSAADCSRLADMPIGSGCIWLQQPGIAAQPDAAQPDATQPDNAGPEQRGAMLQLPFVPRQLQLALLQLQEAEALPNLESLVPPAFELAQGMVLVVEDNQVNQLVITGMLTKMGLGVQLVANGQEAVELLTVDERCFDLVLMDCEMPVLDGYQATSLIRQYERQRRLPRLPIIALTAHVLEEHRQQALTVGMDMHLSKPVEFLDLHAVIAQILRPDELRLGNA